MKRESLKIVELKAVIKKLIHWKRY